VATPAEIYESPSSRYVADFIGSVNMFEGRVEAAAQNLIRIAANEGPVIESASPLVVTKGQSVWFAVRPEKVRISHDAPRDPAVNAIEGEVVDIAYFGDMTLYNVRLGSGMFVRASRLNAERSVERAITWHDQVWLSWAPDAGVVLAR
jgi:putrescine transport system ATP-binding protein